MRVVVLRRSERWFNVNHKKFYTNCWDRSYEGGLDEYISEELCVNDQVTA